MHEHDKLLAEMEQLRTALEQSLAENAQLFDAMNRQRGRIEEQARELRMMTQQLLSESQPAPTASEVDVNATLEAEARRSQTEEELRVAFEELQVMAEELEVANSSLQQANRELDARVDARTRELAMVNAALRESESSFRAVVDVVPDCLWRTDRAGRALWYNQRWYQYTGKAGMGALDEGWLDAVHPADRLAARMSWAIAVGNGSAYSGEHRLRGADGRFRWFLVRAEPVRDERDEVTQWFGAATDVHEQRTAMDALRESELRFRTLVEGMPQLVWRSKGGGRWTWASPQWIEYTGLTDEASSGRGWLRGFHPDDRAAAEAAWAVGGNEPVDFEGRIHCKTEGRYRHFRTRANPVLGENGRVLEWLGTCTDVDDLLRMQQRQGVLVSELQHRTRNLIGVVRSIAGQTLRTSDSLETFEAEFNHRLAALSRVQGLLSRSGEQQITIGALVRMELDALGLPPLGERVRVDGPDVPLRKSVVQTLALAFHELATNALKYGALNTDQGRLSVGWRVDRGENETPHLAVDWREETVRIPPGQMDAVRTSFGRQLIETGLPYSLGAKTCFELSESTLHCSIHLPLGRHDGRRLKDAG